MAHPPLAAQATVPAITIVQPILTPPMVFAAVALVAGVLLTFLSLSLSATSPCLAAVALLVQACTTPLARWGRAGMAIGTEEACSCPQS